jgi:hypothetical protein
MPLKEKKTSEIRFFNLTPEHAASGKGRAPNGMTGQAANSHLYWERLQLNAEQRTAVNVAYATASGGTPFDQFFEGTTESQVHVAALLSAHTLDDASRQDIGQRWSVVWC